MNFPKVIKKGDMIRVKTGERTIYHGYTFEGSVISAFNYGETNKPEWYIEMRDEEFGYIYIKQNETSEKLLGIEIL